MIAPEPQGLSRYGQSPRTPALTFAESQYALGALALLGEGRSYAAQLLHELLRKANPTLVPGMD